MVEEEQRENDEKDVTCVVVRSKMDSVFGKVADMKMDAVCSTWVGERTKNVAAQLYMKEDYCQRLDGFH